MEKNKPVYFRSLVTSYPWYFPVEWLGSTYYLRDGPLQKLWGGGGGVEGNFRAAGIFFAIKFLVWIFFTP